MFEAALSKLPDDFSRVGSHYCKKVGCVFNERRPGLPARATEGSLCRWCDPALLATALDGKAGRRHLSQSLSMMYCRDKTVYKQALQRLPEEFSVDFQPSTNYCQAAGCVFSLVTPGETARSRPRACYCSWCDGDTMAKREKTFRGAQWIARSLKIFKAADEDVFLKAWEKLSEFFQTAPQRVEERRRERRESDAMGAQDLVLRYPKYVEPTVRDRLVMKDGPPCIVCRCADRRPIIREFESRTGAIESVQGMRRIQDSRPVPKKMIPVIPKTFSTHPLFPEVMIPCTTDNYAPLSTSAYGCPMMATMRRTQILDLNAQILDLDRRLPRHDGPVHTMLVSRCCNQVLELHGKWDGGELNFMWRPEMMKFGRLPRRRCCPEGPLSLAMKDDEATQHLRTIVTNPCDHLRGNPVRDEDVHVVPSLFVERVAMVEEDRDASGNRRVGRLAFGVVYDGPQPVPMVIWRWGVFVARYESHCRKPIDEYRRARGLQPRGIRNGRRGPFLPPLSWHAQAFYHRGVYQSMGLPRVTSHWSFQVTPTQSTQAMRDNDGDAHPTLAGTGVYLKLGPFRKERGIDYQEWTYDGAVVTGSAGARRRGAIA